MINISIINVLFSIILLINLYENIKVVNIYKYYKYFDCCLNKTFVQANIQHYYRYIYGKDLWKYFELEKNNSLCKFLRNTNLFKNNKLFYYHRLYSLYNRTNVKVKGKFPDVSYYRLVPKNKIKYDNVITHTYEVQNYIYHHQHPLICNNKKFIIIKGFESGHGSEIHVLTSYLALALALNRIAILDPFYKSMKAVGKFCKNEKNWLCFIEQLTNCSLPQSVFINTTKYINTTQKEKYLYVEGVQTFRSLIPPQIIDILKYAPIYKFKMLHYWRIQGATYIFRLNKRTNIQTNRIIHKSLKNKLYSGCFNIFIRHGDKYREMKLLSSEDYIPSYILFRSIMKKEIPIYFATDDSNVINFYSSINFTKTYYLNFLRSDNFFANMKRGDEMTLNFISDIKASLYCNSFSSTRKSNVARLIDELRSTVGLSANAIYFENGDIKFSDTSYENYEYW